MELKKLIKTLKLNFRLVFLTSALVSLLFSLFYLVFPDSYLAEGTIYVYPVSDSNQKSEVSNELNYSRNLIALSNSPEFKKLIQDGGFNNFSFTPLIGVVGSLRLKEISPNILSFSVVGQSEIEVKNKYKNYLKILNEFSIVLKKGNSNFELSYLSEEPILTRYIRSYIQFLVLGFISGLFLSSFYLYIKKK